MHALAACRLGNPIGAGVTILPVLSAATPRVSLPEERVRALMARIQDAGTEVVKVGGCVGGWMDGWGDGGTGGGGGEWAAAEQD